MGKILNPRQYLSKYRYLFWDFDGVIKDSVLIKGKMFSALFSSYGHEISLAIEKHHLENGGMSRFEKIPLYMSWAGLDTSPKEISIFLNKFSNNIIKNVVNSAWIPGVEDYLHQNSFNQTFFLISATPQEEINDIVILLNIKKVFKSIHGSPINKNIIINNLMSKYGILNKESILIGDSHVDYEAAKINNVNFLLRTDKNKMFIFEPYEGDWMFDFNAN
jgi:phosphoglycolate phosphatase-like HAD superfamily hydrolase